MASAVRYGARAAALAVAVALVALAWAALALLSSRGDLQAARAELAQAQHPSPAASTTELLASAVRHLERAQSRLDQPGPELAAQLPWAGRTVATVDSAVQAALTVSDELRRLVGDARSPSVVAGGRVDLVRLARLVVDLRHAAVVTAGPVHRLDAAATTLVPSSVSAAVATARRQLDGLPLSLSRAADALDAAGGLLGARGPRRLLVVLENNAELRGTGGLVSVFAEGRTRDGRLQLAGFRDVQDVADVPGTSHPPRRVPAPPDYTRLWGPFLANTTLWKNANMSPDIPTSSAVLAAVAGASLPGGAPDAIVWLDVRTIAAVLDATGPATLPDGTVLTGATTVPVLLSQTYRSTTDDLAAQGRRRARLRAAADVVLHRLLGESPDLVRLAPSLAAAAAGRHLAVWSSNPAEERAWTRGSAAGAVSASGGDLASMTVQNFGGGDVNGNKLDFYARRQVSVRATVSSSQAEVEQDVTLRNIAPAAGLPTYVSGRATPGVTNNFVTFAVPAQASLLEFSRGGVNVPTDVLPEGDHRVLTDVVSLPPGTSTSWRLRYRLPLHDGQYRLTLVPQPLAVDAGLSISVSAAAGLTLDGGRHDVSAPFAAVRTLEVRAGRPGLLARLAADVRRFWTSPVRLPG